MPPRAFRTLRITSAPFASSRRRRAALRRRPERGFGIFHNSELAALVRDDYRAQDLRLITTSICPRRIGLAISATIWKCGTLFSPVSVMRPRGACSIQLSRRSTGGASCALAPRRIWTRQISHFNRSLAQITHEWRCAELYYLRDQQYVANPHVPRQWTRQPAHVHTRHAEHGDGAASAQQAGLTGNELRGCLPIANRSSQPRMVLTRGSFVVFV
jgi:hypothetical protein